MRRFRPPRSAASLARRVTPFLLDRIGKKSAGRTLDVNLALLEDNARVAGRIAVAIAAAPAEEL